MERLTYLKTYPERLPMNEPTTESQFSRAESERTNPVVGDDARPNAQWQGYDVEILNAILDGDGLGLRGDG